MGTRDDMLEIADLEGQLETEFGIRENDIFIVQETYDKPPSPGAGCVLLSSVATLVSPRWQLDKLDDQTASFFGAGTQASRAGIRKGTLSAYQVTGITPDFNTGLVAGGYSLETLMQVPADPNHRIIFVVCGPGQRPLLTPAPGYSGEPYHIAIPAERAPDDTYANTFVIKRAPHITP